MSTHRQDFAEDRKRHELNPPSRRIVRAQAVPASVGGRSTAVGRRSTGVGAWAPLHPYNSLIPCRIPLINSRTQRCFVALRFLLLLLSPDPPPFHIASLYPPFESHPLSWLPFEAHEHALTGSWDTGRFKRSGFEPASPAAPELRFVGGREPPPAALRFVGGRLPPPAPPTPCEAPLRFVGGLGAGAA